jgi:hypothetical protein
VTGLAVCSYRLSVWLLSVRRYRDIVEDAQRMVETYYATDRSFGVSVFSS